MTLNERQREILRELEKHRQVRVTALAEQLFASEMTIRRDLEYLENEGFLTRCHGGAVPLGNHLHYPIKYRMWINAKEKKELALRATAHIRDGQVIFINSSSTCAYLVPHLHEFQNLHIITNSVYLVTLLGNQRISCTLMGGDYDSIEQCLGGAAAETFLADLNPDLAILSCEGVTEQGEITESREDMARIAKIAVKNATQSVFLMDSSKQGNKYTYTVCRVPQMAGVTLIL